MDEELRMCPNCKNMVSKWEIVFTRDCHGIPFRPVCQLCYAELMRDGYDGEYYTEADECIDDEY